MKKLCTKSGRKYGTVGEYAGEINGIKLYVGDIVQFYDKFGYNGVAIVVKNESYSDDPDRPEYSMYGYCSISLEETITKDLEVVVDHYELTNADIKNYTSCGIVIDVKISETEPIVDF